ERRGIARLAGEGLGGEARQRPRTADRSGFRRARLAYDPAALKGEVVDGDIGPERQPELGLRRLGRERFGEVVGAVAVELVARRGDDGDVVVGRSCEPARETQPDGDAGAALAGAMEPAALRGRDDQLFARP